MWTLYNLPNAVYETMKQENYELPYGALYEGDDAVKNCVVLFGGYCSGVVVSPDGLVFTNHHCGFESIRSHSTVEHDYMLNGFVSNSYEEELPNKDLYVSFMVEQKDVTSQLDSLGLDTLPENKRGDFIDSLENVFQKQVHAQDSTLRAELKPYYYGNKHYLIAWHTKKKAMCHFDLNNIQEIEVLDEYFTRDTNFSLEAFSQQSFGVYQEEPFDVEWKFDKDVAKEAAKYIFHPTQEMIKNPDGTLTVKFRAGGAREMDWHLYTWGKHVKVIQPKDFNKRKVWKD